MSIYGVDVSTFAGLDGAVDCDPVGNTIEGSRAVLECAARCLMSPPGSVPGCGDWGYDLVGRLGGRVTPVQRERVRFDLESMLARNERVRRAQCAEITLLAGGRWRVRVVLELLGGSSFALTLAVGRVTVEILGIERVSTSA